MLGAFLVTFGDTGHYFGVTGHHLWHLFPHFGPSWNFGTKARGKWHSLGSLFGALEDTFCSCGQAKCENGWFLGHPGLRSEFWSILGQILGGLGLQKRGFRVRGVVKITVSLILEFDHFWAPLWTSFWVQNWEEMTKWSPLGVQGCQKGCQKWRSVF
jgi:hypothetical protein